MFLAVFSKNHVIVEISLKEVEELCFTHLTLERLASLPSTICPGGKGAVRWGDFLVASLEDSFCTSKGGNKIVQSVFC